MTQKPATSQPALELKANEQPAQPQPPAPKAAADARPLPLTPRDEAAGTAARPSDKPVPVPARDEPAPQQGKARAEIKAPAPRSAPQPRRIAETAEGVAMASGAPRPAAAKRAAAPARAHVPANDDMPSIGGLIYALQQRPSRSPFVVALIGSAVWFALALLISWAVFQKSVDTSAGIADILANPAIVVAMAIVVVPIALFWFIALLIWRAQELRLMSSAMTEVAVRLAEPDRMAEQSVASLGQTVRRQVAAMNDAISRALGRAGELEALVHNEVAALERSYSENENRIRNLIHELSSEREALANNSDRVSEALRGVGSQVTREIAAASEKATQALGQASAGMAETFVSRGHKITAAVTAAGAAIDERLAERSARLTEQLMKHGAQAAESMRQSGLEVTRAIQETSDRTAAAISAKGNSLVTSVIGMSERVGREVPALLEKLGTEQTRLGAIIDGATRNLSALEGALSEKTQSLGLSLADRTKMLQTVLSEQTRAMDNAFAERVHALEGILSRRTQHLDVTLNERSKALEQTIGSHASSIQRAVEELSKRSTSGSEALSGQAKVLKEASSSLLNQIGGLTKRFEDQGAAIMSAARTFEMSNSKIDSMMEARQAGLSKLLEGIGTRASELDRMMNSYSHMLEQSLSQAELRARKVTELLAKDSAEKSQAAIRDIERLRHDAQTHTAKAVSELQANFSSLSDQVAEQLTTLSTKFTDTTRHVRDTTRRATVDLEAAQSELQRHAKGLPETAKQSAAAMRQALQDQLSALDTLSELSNRHSYASAVSAPERRAEAQRRDSQPPHDAAFPPPRASYDYESQPQRPFPRPFPGELPAGSASPQGFPEQPQERRNQWSLGDLLARASEDEHGAFAAKDESYGIPPIAAPVGTRNASPADAGMNFNMADIASCIDERRVMEVWQRLKRGETEILDQRGLYSRQGQAIVDRVRWRYEKDETFRVIAERYCSDFEKMLQDLSKSENRGASVQSSLAADNGRIYFVLAHISGRLG